VVGTWEKLKIVPVVESKVAGCLQRRCEWNKHPAMREHVGNKLETNKQKQRVEFIRVD